jgi:hypothetical protein
LIGTTLVVAGVLFGRRSIAALIVEAIASTDNSCDFNWGRVGETMAEQRETVGLGSWQKN